MAEIPCMRLMMRSVAFSILLPNPLPLAFPSHFYPSWFSGIGVPSQQRAVSSPACTQMSSARGMQLAALPGHEGLQPDAVLTPEQIVAVATAQAASIAGLAQSVGALAGQQHQTTRDVEALKAGMQQSKPCLSWRCSVLLHFPAPVHGRLCPCGCQPLLTLRLPMCSGRSPG